MEFRAVGGDLGTGMGYLGVFRGRDGAFRVLRGDLGTGMGAVRVLGG